MSDARLSTNGVGPVAPRVADRLFEPFETTKHNGMGIGTYESFQYIRELGGSIAVDSARKPIQSKWTVERSV